jgi:hypothetical protein
MATLPPFAQTTAERQTAAAQFCKSYFCSFSLASDLASAFPSAIA